MTRQHDFFVTGTDTEVGKTLATAALLQALNQRGGRALGMKPIAAGSEWRHDAWWNEDVAQLRAASYRALATSQICPFLLREPAAPHLVAQQEGVRIDLQTIVEHAQQLKQECDQLLIEGVGGFRVPLNESEDSADLAQALDLPVILVVGIRLGCINHALLTAEAIRARGLRIAGWIANCVAPSMLFQTNNIATLQANLQDEFQAPMVGVIPWLEKFIPAQASEQEALALAQRAATCLDLAVLGLT